MIKQKQIQKKIFSALFFLTSEQKYSLLNCFGNVACENYIYSKPYTDCVVGQVIIRKVDCATHRIVIFARATQKGIKNNDTLKWKLQEIKSDFN